MMISNSEMCTVWGIAICGWLVIVVQPVMLVILPTTNATHMYVNRNVRGELRNAQRVRPVSCMRGTAIVMHAFNVVVSSMVTISRVTVVTWVFSTRMLRNSVMINVVARCAGSAGRLSSRVVDSVHVETLNIRKYRTQVMTLLNMGGSSALIRRHRLFGQLLDESVSSRGISVNVFFRLLISVVSYNLAFATLMLTLVTDTIFRLMIPFVLKVVRRIARSECDDVTTFSFG